MIGRAREDRASQDERLAVAQVGEARIEDFVDDGKARVEVLVNRRAHHHHDELALAQGLWARSERQLAVGQNAVKDLLAAFFGEWHHALADLFQLGGVDVVDDRFQARVGEDQRQRQSHVPGPTDDTNVFCKGHVH